MNSKEAIKNIAQIPNKLNTTGGTLTGALKLKGTTMTSSINCNRLEGREELQIYAAGDAYMEGSKGAGIHLYGNNDIEHSGNIAMMTGANDNGTARMIISEKGNVTLGNALWDFVDEGKDFALLNIKGKSGVPGLLFHGVAKTDGEIAVPLNENFSIGHYDTANNIFTSRFEINGTGNVIANSALTVNANINTTGEIQHKGTTIIKNNDTSTILSCKKGYMYFRPNGNTDTTGQVTIDLNGNVTAPKFTGALSVSNNSLIGMSEKQVSNIGASSITFTNTIEGKPSTSSIGMHNRNLEFYSNNFFFYDGPLRADECYFGMGEGKSGCHITTDGLDSNFEFGFNMGSNFKLGYITCMSVVQASDKRTKEDIKYINNDEDKLKPKDFYNFMLNDFKPVSFKYKKDLNNIELGFIAQDIKETKLSEYIIRQNKNDDMLIFNSYSYTSAIAIALQQAIKEIEFLKNEIDILKNNK